MLNDKYITQEVGWEGEEAGWDAWGGHRNFYRKTTPIKDNAQRYNVDDQLPRLLQGFPKFHQIETLQVNSLLHLNM